MKKNFGFTLVEIGMVMVVIGLIIGGILTGRDLILAAESRRVAAQIETYNTAFMAFRNKYHCLPGDCNTAEVQGLGTTGAAGRNGNNNGIIGVIDESEKYESPNFFYHLMQAKMISDIVPGSSLGGYGLSQYPAATASYHNALGQRAVIMILNPDRINNGLGTQPFFHGYYITSSETNGADAASSMLPSELYRIDVKLDDGAPGTGIVLATGDDTADPLGPTYATEGAVGSEACIAEKRYNVSSYAKTTSNMCSALIGAAF